jgi:C1A family cysteine protease
MVRVALLTTLALGAQSQDVKKRARGFIRTSMNADLPVASFTPEQLAAVPSAIDWSTRGATTRVKDQGYCGSCWAFSTVEGIESGVFMTTGTLPQPLSTQQLISCDKNDWGCDGGDLPSAFAYVQKEGGIDTEAHYPDTSHNDGRDGTCKVATHTVKVTGAHWAVPECTGGTCSGQDENGLKAALATYGPLSICVNANDWDGYTSGVYSRACSGSYNSLDHCVQLVGYDTTAATPYWKVRNSWGEGWGERGFIRLPMGVNSCGVADEAMYVTATMAMEDEVV